MNLPNFTLQYGENTLDSFKNAYSLGATHVEFGESLLSTHSSPQKYPCTLNLFYIDIQLTKDKVPVVYHDWLIQETGFPLEISQLTLKEFLSIRPSALHPSLGLPSSLIKGTGCLDDLCLPSKIGPFKMDKGNGEGYIQYPFTTLEEMLKVLDINIGFNVEIKYVFIRMLK